MTTSRDARPAHGWLVIAPALLGPIVLMFCYLATAASVRASTGAEGYARAALDQQMYLGFALVLASFVMLGTLCCRGGRARAIFGTAAALSSLFAMFLGFFGEMAP